MRPPPLPGAFKEPFPKAKSDPSPLSDTPAPESIRMRSTPPEGTPLPRRTAEQSYASPLEDTIRDLRLTNVLLREKLTAATSLTTPSPPPVSLRTMTKRELAKVGGKWTILLTVAALALPVAAKKWPAYADIIEYVRSLLP
jgi:hypothetical protein